MENRHLRYHITFAALAGALLLSIYMSLNIGSVKIPPMKILKIVFLGQYGGTTESLLIWRIRLPRLLAAAVMGGALSVAGYLLQAFFRNPIVGPFVLGISSGAKMFVGFTMIVMLRIVGKVPPYAMVLSAFIGSLFSMFFVLIFAKRTSGISMLLVIGIMIGYICSAVTDFFITFASQADIANLTAWSMGSFSGISWDDLAVAGVIILLAFIGAMMMSKSINAYSLGENYAKSVGVNIRLFRGLLVVISSLLAACVTAFAGPISFVGIAVPHITKSMLKTSAPLVAIPACFICGAVFCTLCDLIARTAFSPAELAIGTVTSIFGAPVVIWLLLKRRSGSV